MTACFTALSERSEPSVGTRMLAYIAISVNERKAESADAPSAPATRLKRGCCRLLLPPLLLALAVLLEDVVGERGDLLRVELSGEHRFAHELQLRRFRHGYTGSKTGILLVRAISSTTSGVA